MSAPETAEERPVAERLEEIEATLTRIVQLQVRQIEALADLAGPLVEMRREHREDMEVVAKVVERALGTQKPQKAKHPRPRRERRCHLRLVE